ncbi:uncharacterized protein [Rutidosis leptorrhynchoides]|uniref:uncharacterized protein n=1 Tax=Rutidosis leptorrhynchoides TaxID=125765 RepID=UPI003A991288
MAANLIPIKPPLATATNSGNQKSDSQLKKWWTPLFGWSSEPDYIDSVNIDKITTVTDRRMVRSTAKFTDEKARKLRMLTIETESFHVAMYHSAIASRLASDFSDRKDQ